MQIYESRSKSVQKTCCLGIKIEILPHVISAQIYLGRTSHKITTT